MTDERFKELAEEIANTFCERDRVAFAAWFNEQARKAKTFDALVKKQLTQDAKGRAYGV